MSIENVMIKRDTHVVWTWDMLLMTGTPQSGPKTVDGMWYEIHIPDGNPKVKVKIHLCHKGKAEEKSNILKKCLIFVRTATVGPEKFYKGNQQTLRPVSLNPLPQLICGHI